MSATWCRIDGFDWHYVGAIVGVAAARACWRSRPPTSTRCRPSAATRSSISGSPSAWSVVFLHRRSASSFFAKARRPVLARLARQLLRRRPAGAARRSAARCSCWCGAGPREGRLDRRTVDRRRRRARRGADQRAASAARHRRPHRRRVRRPRRRPLAAHAAPACRKLGTVDDLVEFARRTRIDLVIFSLPISAESAHPADAQEAVGAAGRHPAVGAYQQAALPPALLFLHRHGAGARRLRPADHRLGRR